MNEPRPVSPPPATPSGRGSLLLGIALAWGVLIGGYVLLAGLAAAMPNFSSDGAVLIGLLLPWLGMIALIVLFAARDRPRTALGIVVGIVTIIAVGVLLVAACFGLLASNFR